MSAESCIQAQIIGKVGVLTLRRPQALNALTLDMVRDMHQALDGWRDDAKVAAVVVRGDGKAFCAGGDIRAVRAATLAGEHGQNRAFFGEEYALNHAISTYPKPYISLIHGACMGGGMGISVHGRYRVVAENLVMAMPETAIGFFPDVGGSYFLSRLDGGIGLYLGLSGARVGAADALYCGLATHHVPYSAFDVLVDALAAGDAPDEVLTRFAVEAGASALSLVRAQVDACFQGTDPAAIMTALAADQSDWAADTLAALRGVSPQSMRVTAQAVDWAKGRDLGICLSMELALALALCQSADFIEGVRAMLVDKDRTALWRAENEVDFAVIAAGY